MIEDGMPKMKPLKSRIEAILKVKPPTTVKECRSFCRYGKLYVHLLTQFTREVDSLYTSLQEKEYLFIGEKNNKKLLIVSNKMLQMHQCY